MATNLEPQTPSGTLAPDELFKIHRRPWADGGTGFVVDADAFNVAGATVKELLAVINADAPVEFKAGLYWMQAPKGGDVQVKTIANVDTRDQYLKQGWKIGKLATPEF